MPMLISIVCRVNVVQPRATDHGEDGHANSQTIEPPRGDAGRSAALLLVWFGIALPGAVEAQQRGSAP